MAEDTVGKGEYVGYQHFLLFQQYLKEKKFRVFFWEGGGGEGSSTVGLVR